jgi:hypothetical protein
LFKYNQFIHEVKNIPYVTNTRIISDKFKLNLSRISSTRALKIVAMSSSLQK